MTHLSGVHCSALSGDSVACQSKQADHVCMLLQNPPYQGDWTEDTLLHGCYDYGSDVYQIGVMLDKYLQTHSATLQDQEFSSLLKSKVPAEVALQHAWLQFC